MPPSCSSRIGRAVDDDRTARRPATRARPVQEREEVPRGPVDVLDEPDRRRVADERIEAFEPGGEELLLLDGRPEPRLADGGEDDPRRRRRAASRRAACTSASRPPPSSSSCATGSKGESRSGRSRAVSTTAPAAAALSASSRSSRDLPTPGGATIVSLVVRPTSAASCSSSRSRPSVGRAHQPERALPRPLGAQRPHLHGAKRRLLALQLERRQRLELGDLGDRERGHLTGDDAARARRRPGAVPRR